MMANPTHMLVVSLFDHFLRNWTEKDTNYSAYLIYQYNLWKNYFHTLLCGLEVAFLGLAGLHMLINLCGGC